jgi:hypothetical protein
MAELAEVTGNEVSISLMSIAFLYCQTGPDKRDFWKLRRGAELNYEKPFIMRRATGNLDSSIRLP